MALRDECSINSINIFETLIVPLSAFHLILMNLLHFMCIFTNCLNFDQTSFSPDFLFLVTRQIWHCADSEADLKKKKKEEKNTLRSASVCNGARKPIKLTCSSHVHHNH